MAEKTILVCDECGAIAVETVKITTSKGTVERDLCRTHLSRITAGGRKPRRGRPTKARASGKRKAAAPSDDDIARAEKIVGS